MAGQPKKRAIVAELTQRARAEIGESATPLDYAVEWIESGKTILALSQNLTAALKVEVTRGGLSRILNDIEPAAEGRLAIARRAGAHGMAEEALDLADTAGDSREEIAKAKLRSDVRHWHAGKWNREEYGESKTPLIQLSVNGLHLDALRALAVDGDGIHNPTASIVESVQGVDYEILSERDDEQLELDMSRPMPLAAGSSPPGAD